MQEMLQDNMMVRIMAEPLWLQAWIYWMMLLNTAALFFLRHREAKVVLAVWVGNVITMSLFYELFGYVRLLGLSHVIWWTPLVIYLFRRRQDFPAGFVATWLWVLLATNSASLVIDYIDVVRYFMGDGDLARILHQNTVMFAGKAAESGHCVVLALSQTVTAGFTGHLA